MIALLAALAAAGPAPADTSFSYKVGAVQVIQEVDTSTRLVAVGVYLLGGTSLLTPTTAGVEDLFLHAAARGTRSYPRGVARALARTGSELGFDVREDWSAVWIQGFAADFDSSWAVVGDLIVHPTLTDTTVELSRALLLSAAQIRYDDPEERIQAMAESVMFAGHPYAVDPRGNPTSLGRLTAADVRNFQQRELVASRLLVVVVGNVAQAHVTALLQNTLGALPAGSYHWSLPPALPYREEGRTRPWIVQNRPLPTTYLLGYCTGPTPTDPGYWPFRILNSIYSGYLGDIRDKGLSYAVSAPFLDRALPVGGFQMSTSTPDQAFDMALSDLKDLTQITSDDDASGAEDMERTFAWIRQTRRQFMAGLREEQSSVLGAVDVLARAQLYYGDFRKTGAFLPGANAFDGRNLGNAASLCRSRLQYAFLGDTARMHGKW